MDNTSIYKIPITTIDGEQTTLEQYQGRVLLIVNVASRCGFTPQYAGLENLYRSYQDRGFAVLGFPCNQFGQQEPGIEAEIKEFCRSNYDVTFPLFGKVEVNGRDAHPLFNLLKSEARGVFGTREIKWNFTKFLVDRTGSAAKRFTPQTKPEKLTAHIEKLI